MDGFWPNLHNYIVVTWKRTDLIFLWPWPNFQGHRRAQIVGKWLFCTLSPRWIDGFWPNLYSYIVETGTRSDETLVTLTSFSRSQWAQIVGKWLVCTLSHEGWILIKLAQLYCCDMKKNWLNFGDLDPIFKVTGGLRLLENGFSAPYLQIIWMDFDQTCTAILLR